MSTVTKIETVQIALNDANPAKLNTALQKLAFGDVMSALSGALTPVVETITLGAVAATIDLSVKSASKLPALMIQSVRVTDVTGGTADAGVRMVTDSGGAAAAKGAALAGVCTLSDDGKTLTFEGTVKAIKIKWIPVPAALASLAAGLAKAFASQ